MKIVHSTVSGEVVGVYYDRDVFPSFYAPNAAYNSVEIDEVAPDNQDICKALAHSVGRYNAQGLQRFYVVGGVLTERDPWEEYQDGG